MNLKNTTQAQKYLGGAQFSDISYMFGIIHGQKIIAVLIHAYALALGVKRQRTVQAFRHSNLELP